MRKQFRGFLAKTNQSATRRGGVMATLIGAPLGALAFHLFSLGGPLPADSGTYLAGAITGAVTALAVYQQPLC